MGFKLKSNKELPSTSQKFGYIIPLTDHKKSGSDSPYDDQQYPMFAKIDLANEYIVLCRVENVLFDSKHSISQQQHGNGNMTIKIARRHIKQVVDGETTVVDEGIYGVWSSANIEDLNKNNKLIGF